VVPIVLGEQCGALDGVEPAVRRRCAHRGQMVCQRSDIADREITGARNGEFAMGGDIAEDHRQAIACGFQYRDRLAFKA